MVRYVCECDYRTGFCGLTMPSEVYDVLSNGQRACGDDLYIVHEDHAAGEEEIAREGDWLLVRAAIGAMDE